MQTSGVHVKEAVSPSVTRWCGWRCQSWTGDVARWSGGWWRVRQN